MVLLFQTIDCEVLAVLVALDGNLKVKSYVTFEPK